MDKVTPEQCKQVVRESGLLVLGHHRCGGCGVMVGYEFTRHTNIHPSWQTALGCDGPSDIVVRFNSSCDCGGPWREGVPESWSDFAETFNMQTPEHRAAMWERFKAGKATHESD